MTSPAVIQANINALQAARVLDPRNREAIELLAFWREMANIDAQWPVDENPAMNASRKQDLRRRFRMRLASSPFDRTTSEALQP